MTDAASRLLEQLEAFAALLDDDERAVLAALVAPGIALAYRVDPATGAEDDDIGWAPDLLTTHLAAAIRHHHLRIVEP